jgi:hypothetical protein
LLLTLFAAVRADEYDIPPAKREHWAWQRPVRPALPKVQDSGWTRNSLDNFILARLEAAGLRPARPASREQLLRRVTFDLIGLPPMPGELSEFLADERPDAWEHALERLLASPHYGERWGRHWLDLARYADSNGYEFDEVRPDAWRYRDYVITSLNADKPYDRFIHEQLAGDELWPDDPQALIATGFNLLGPDMTDASEQAQRRLNTLNDMTDTTALAFLGFPVAVAGDNLAGDPAFAEKLLQGEALADRVKEEHRLAPPLWLRAVQVGKLLHVPLRHRVVIELAQIAVLNQPVNATVFDRAVKTKRDAIRPERRCRQAENPTRADDVVHVGHRAGGVVMAFVQHEQVDVSRRVLLEHRDEADRLDVDALVPVLGLGLLEQIPSHGDPADADARHLLQGLGNHQPHHRLAAAGR